MPNTNAVSVETKRESANLIVYDNVNHSNNYHSIILSIAVFKALTYRLLFINCFKYLSFKTQFIRSEQQYFKELIIYKLTMKKQQPNVKPANQLLLLAQNHRGRPFKGNQKFTVLPGYPETQFSLVDYFDKFGISGGLIFEQQQDFCRKNIIESEFNSLIKKIIDELKSRVEQAESLTIDDVVVLLNALTTCVDNMCTSQYCQLLLTIFESIGASQTTIQKLKSQFLQKSFFFSLKFKQLAKNKKQTNKNLTAEMVSKIKKKISKNIRNRNKKKQNKKKKEKKDSEQDQGQSEQDIKTLSEDKQTINEQFGILFNNLRKDMIHFVTDVNHRQQYLAQERAMISQLSSLVQQTQNN